jgi:phospholipid/cholesterol/gamma-HCH transport system substrate-binding protein
VKRAISEHLVDFAAIIVLLVLSTVVGLYILSNQRLNAPAWVPVLGKDFYELKAEFQTAQALSPGQGQTVDIAGVKVGEISKVDLKNGRALVTMNIERKYAEGEDGRPAIYRDARMLLRPKTGLKDMIVELSPGTPAAGREPDGGTIPLAQTLPDVNPDEVLAALDADTRQYLVLLLNGGATGLKGNSNTLANTLRRFEPTSRDGLKLTEQLQKRAAAIRRVTTNFSKLAGALAGKDDQLAQLIDSSNAVFQAFANQDSNLRSALQQLPPTLTQAQSTLAKTRTLADTLGPTAQALLPAARNLAPANVAVRQLAVQSTPIIRDQIRPFTRVAQPVVRELQPAVQDLTALTPDLTTSFDVLNYAVNELAYNPAGSEEGFLFWLPWFAHNLGGIYTTGDANGPIRRGEIVLSCFAVNTAVVTAQAFAVAQLINDLSNAPKPSNLRNLPDNRCPPGPAAPTGAAARSAAPDESTPSSSQTTPRGGEAGTSTTPQPSAQEPTLTDKPTTTAPSAATPRDAASATTPRAGGGR